MAVKRLDEGYTLRAATAEQPLTVGPLTSGPSSASSGGTTRILQGTSATITKSFYSGSTLVDPDVVAVTVLDSEGATVTTGTAGGTGVAERTFTLLAAYTALLDSLTVRWTSPTLGTLTSTVEVVGGFLFSVVEARTMRPLDNTTAYTDADIQAMRTTVEDALEKACGYAFVPRYDSATLNGGDSLLRLRPYLRNIRWASTTTAGVTTPLTADALSVLQVSEAGFVSGYPWTVGYGNVRVGYEHGMDRPPERIRQAALLLAKVWLVSGPVDDRATSFSSAETGATYSMMVPGRGGSITGVPECDAAIAQYRLPSVA